MHLNNLGVYTSSIRNANQNPYHCIAMRRNAIARQRCQRLKGILAGGFALSGLEVVLRAS